ncbi:PQQ-binding-like beta-propeller repeat protein [Halostagnicola sp. A-GB9-2]|uniref:PQQ-binding-like beta-propeller repeat protein n=1 Tax=Halostagnicola sp. A-GB9-2 TaxID=3048066 RepID=UPI0024C09BF3|nr:PQQ-binding-like beta-propeller repeat protein [Halostagnicola sp. A-GB9-2]MDJ1431105.1 PQQ-binding-like beta-propeller repeat protein [Halostagnicola sp. A-GB9-2]
MTTWKRRSILATCAALSTGGALASAGSTAANGATESVGTSSSSVAVGDPPGWSSALGNAGNSRYLPLEGEFPKPDTEAWRYDEAALPDSKSHDDTEKLNIAVVDGMAYVGTDDGELHALEADEGTVAWRTDVEMSSRPTVLGGTIYLSGENHVTALDAADGTVEWEREFDAGDSEITNPTAAYGAVYVVAGGSLYALEADDGSTRWHRDDVDVESADEADGDPQPRPFQAEPVAAGHGFVYAMTETGDLGGIAALEGETGDDAWVLEAIDPIRPISTIVVTSDRVFTHHHMIADDVDKVYHHDPKTGELSFSEEAYTNMLDIVAAPEHCVTIGVHRLTGYEYGAGERWSHSEREYSWFTFGRCLIAGDTVIATRSSFDPETILGLDLEDGTEQWSLESPLGSLVAVDERTIYILEHSDLHEDSDLVALRASDADQDDDDDPDDDDDSDGEGEPDDGDDSDGEDEPDDGDDSDGEGEPNDDDDSDGEGKPDDGNDSDDGDDSDGDDDKESNCDCKDGDDSGTGDGDGTDDEESSSDTDSSDGGNGSDGENGPDNGDEDDGGTGGDGGSESDDDVTEPGEDDGNESDDDPTESGEDDDNMPGFTTGAGVVSGALGLEWLRRKASTDESIGVEESTE